MIARFGLLFTALLAVIGLFTGSPWRAEAMIEQIYTLPFSVTYTKTCGFGCYPGHEGTDYVVGSSSPGDDIVAGLAGYAYVYYSSVRPGPGNHVSMDHTNGHRTRYLHLQDISVSNGQFVYRGSVVGHEGETGTSDGAVHLHFETRVDAPGGPGDKVGNAVDPYGSTTYMWKANPPTYPTVWKPWVNWGPAWAGGSGTELGSAIAHENDEVQAAHTHLARVSSKVEIRNWTGAVWTSWEDISGGLGGFSGKVGISNHENEVHVVVVSYGSLWRRKKTFGGAWGLWENLGNPSGQGINGPVAVAFSSGRTAVAAVAQGNVYFKKYQSGWGGWSSLGGSGTLGEAMAITTRPNGLYHTVVFRPADHTVWTNCSSNGTSWVGWSNLGGSLDNALGADNSYASTCNLGGTHPGVHIDTFSSASAYLRCWDNYSDCASGWENHGSMFVGPTAVVNKKPSNKDEVQFLTRNQNDIWYREKEALREQ